MADANVHPVPWMSSNAARGAANLDERPRMKEQIDRVGAVQMPPLDDDRTRAHSRNPPGRLARRGQRIHLNAGQRGRLSHIGGHDGRGRDEAHLQY